MTPPGQYMLGVDGGNTKTIALVAAPDGTIVGSARGSCSDIYGWYNGQSGEAAVASAFATLETTVRAALSVAGIQPSDLLAGGYSLAGADWPEDLVLLRTAMEDRGFGRQVIVVNDAIGALLAGSPEGTGVSVVCGTGAAVGARTSDGRLWHASHWMEPLGAALLAGATLRAVYRAELGINPPTTLTGHVLSIFGLEHVHDVLHLLTARDSAARPDAGRLVDALLEEAQAGDGTAQRIVQAQGTALGDYALAAARSVGLQGAPFALVLAGGVFRHRSTLLPEAMIARVQAMAPLARPVRATAEPAIGSLLLAFESAGVAEMAPVRSRLLATLPPPALFATHQPYQQTSVGDERARPPA